jgi:hypothetical protein
VKPKWKREARRLRKRARVDRFEAAIRRRVIAIHGTDEGLMPGPWPLSVAIHPIQDDLEGT